MINIEDVTPILSLNNLTFLNISNNKLEEIPNLNKLSNLETLYLTQNSIRDFSLLDSTKYKYINIKGQKISDISSNKITKLSYPPIFLNAKEKSNFMYSNSKFEFIGCEESDDGTGIVLDKDIQVANVRIKTGKLRDTVWTINIVNDDNCYSMEVYKIM